MTAISDEYMREMMGKTKAYVVVILKSGPSREMPGADKIVWEHGVETSPLGSRVFCP